MTQTFSNGDTPQDHSETSSTAPDVVIITGMSGAGRTEAMHTFEDLGYFCIDNLPPSLIMNMISLASLPGQNEIGRKLAIVCDARNREYFKQLVGELANMEAAGVTFRVIFLDAADSILIARYKASRRRHPLCINNKRSIGQAISYERSLTQELRSLADSYIDTSNMSPRELREELRRLYSKQTAKEGMNVTVYSFGFKHGAPTDADIVIDVRFLPNPYYIDTLKEKTGNDPEVQDYVMQNDKGPIFLEKLKDMVEFLIPNYILEGKNQLVIAIGCTGGKHRSVTLANALYHTLETEESYGVRIEHRDIGKDSITKRK